MSCSLAECGVRCGPEEQPEEQKMLEGLRLHGSAGKRADGIG